ncbi:MAG: hypothetical protein BWZ10_00217 [candidate division BRC1 bacterium ADurb.BinA364]|nr:MAG: hypothetical protein BWZ10_00217 [candidate division BRC1 bacterium ADurb.BinA364]
MVVQAKAIALRVAVGEQPPLQHLVGREADAGHDVGGIERRLFDFGEVVFGILVQLQHADVDQRIILVRPDLGQVEGIEGELRRVFFRDDLDFHIPARKVAFFDALEEVALVALAAFADDRLGFGVGQALDALPGLEVELDPETLVFGVDQAEGMAAVAVHVAVGQRNAALAHGDGDLVQRFGQRGPEVPVVARAAQIGLWIALHGVVQIGELERIAQEKHRGVVADQVPVAFLGVELDGESANVALRIRRSAFAGHGGEADEQVRLLADRGEDFGLGVFRDVMRDGESSIGARPLGVHAAFGNHFAIEVGQFFQKPDILQQLRPARTGGHHVLVVRDRRSDVVGQLLGHGMLSFSGLVDCGFGLAAHRRHKPRASMCSVSVRPMALSDSGKGSWSKASLAKSRASPHCWQMK